LGKIKAEIALINFVIARRYDEAIANFARQTVHEDDAKFEIAALRPQ